MKLLILGGTADGRKLATALHQQGVEIVYSVAGLVRTPDIGCLVISGGFSQFGGLASYLILQGIDAIADVTHPYAQTMTTTAVAAAQECDIPYWRFHRLAWQPNEKSRWHEFNCWKKLSGLLQNHQNILFTVGQLSPELIRLLANYSSEQNLVIRTAAPPKFELLANMQWLKAIGPFTLEHEITLMNDYGIDALISKNSGGDSTSAKLVAAEDLNIPVYMQARPRLPCVKYTFSDLSVCQSFIIEQVNKHQLLTRNNTNEL